MKKLFTILAAALFSVSMMASTVDDLKVISEDYSVYFEDVVTSDVTAGTLITDYVLSQIANSYKTNKGTDATVGKLYCLRVKSKTQDVLAFKVSKECTLVLYADRATDRTPYLDTKVAAQGESSITGTPTATNGAKGYVTYSIPAAGTYYIIGNGSDCFLAGLEFTFVADDPTKATVTNITVDEEDLEGFDAATLAYDVELPYSYEGLPVVAATTDNGATVAITQVAELPGTATVVCTSKDESTSVIYTINFTKKATGNKDATLKDLQLNGTTVAGFAADKYEYNVELGYYDAVNVVATPNDEHVLAILISDNETDQVTIEVTAEDGETSLLYTINYTHKERTELVSISGNTTWDWTEAGETADLRLTTETNPTKSEEFNFADLLSNPGANFKAASLEGIMEYVYRQQGKYQFCQGTQLRFVTTVPGKLEVVYSNTGSRTKPEERRFLVVNGKSYGEGTMDATPDTISEISVVAGEVKITSILNDGKETASQLRFNKVVFTKSGETAVENAEATEKKAVKVVENGQLFIIKNGVKYNAQGAIVK